MIFGDWARWLNGGFVGASTLLFCIACLSVVYLLSAASLRRAPAMFREHFLWAIVIFPWLAALLVSLVVFSPSLAPFKPAWLVDLTHWHHSEVFDFGSWHSLPLVSLATLILWIAARQSHIVFRHTKNIALFEQWLAIDAQPEASRLFSTSAFTYGLLRPRVFIGPRLKSQLSPSEFDIVSRHEQSHVGRRDPLKKFMFSCFANAFPRPLASGMKAQLSLSLEQIADGLAAKTDHDKTLLAKTLLKVHRLHRDIPISAFCAFSGSELAERVHYLMTPTSNRRYYYGAATLLFMALFGFSLMSVDSYHHGFEQLFQH